MNLTFCDPEVPRYSLYGSYNDAFWDMQSWQGVFQQQQTSAIYSVLA